MKIKECRDLVLQLIRKYYPTNLKINKVDSQEIVNKFFLTQKHLEAISEVAKKHHMIIVFRNAGEYSIKRILQGNPCKGHSILSKTFKKKDGIWTYKCERNEDWKNKFSGYVGYTEKKDKSKNPPTLRGFYAIDSHDRIVSVPIDKVEKYDTLKFFTGDYDMEDLFLTYNGVTQRALGGVIEEKDAINYINLKISKCDPKRSIIQNFSSNTTSCEYSLIRHGAQSSYISLLLSKNGERELKDAILELQDKEQLVKSLQEKTLFVDKNLCAVDECGNWYLLDNLDRVVSFYTQRNLIDKIPFYYFLSKLVDKNLTKDEKEAIIKMESYINSLLIHWYKTSL